MTEQVLKQRSNEWRERRLGLVTASRFKAVLTPPKSKADKLDGLWSATARSYMLEKLSELLTCAPADRWSNKAMAWGTEWEEKAFEAARPEILKQFGGQLSFPEGDKAFIEHATEKYIGCSPDGIIDDDGLLEIKCPYNPVNHLATVLSKAMPEDHVDQVQGSLWVTGRKWYAFVSYDHRVTASGLDPLFMVRVERDEEYIQDELAPKVIRFRDWLMAEYERLVSKAKPF